MIVNRTTYNEKDMRILCSKTKKTKAFWIRVVITVLVDAFSVCWGIYCLKLYCDYNGRGFPGWYLPLTGLLFALPVWTAFSFATRKKRAAKALMKELSRMGGCDREITFGEDEAVVSSAANGIETTSKYSYDIMKVFYTDEDGVYIMMKRGEQDVFMPVHDNGYAEGSKEELIDLLESRGAKRESL